MHSVLPRANLHHLESRGKFLKHPNMLKIHQVANCALKYGDSPGLPVSRQCAPKYRKEANNCAFSLTNDVIFPVLIMINLLSISS